VTFNAALLTNRPMRRPEWSKNEYIALKGEEWVWLDGDYASLGREDYLAADWEVATDPFDGQGEE
jgi:hypothetical protein